MKHRYTSTIISTSMYAFYYSTALLLNRPIYKNDPKSYADFKGFSFLIYYRETYFFTIECGVLTITKNKGLVHQVVKVQCHVTKMYFCLNIPLQMPMLHK